MLNLNSLMLGTSQIDVMAKFYEAIFQRPADMTDGGMHGWSIGNTFIGIGEHSEVSGQSKDPSRLIFNFETKEVKEEFERIKEIEGATVVKEPYEMGGAWIATLADPDGNYFQLMTPWES
jgi:predicted enzyme related to lactoylglutathione lyase